LNHPKNVTTCSRLTKSNNSYQKLLSEAESQAKLDSSSVFPLQCKIQRLETETDSLRAHSTYLENEHREKTEELASLKSTAALESSQARANVDAAQLERDEIAMESRQLRAQLERLQAKTEGMSRELLDAKQEVSDIRLNSEEELIASRRFNDLQKEQILQLQQKHDGLAKQMNAMKIMAREAESEDIARWNERENELKEVSQRVLKEQTDDYKQKLESMQNELEAANKRCKRAEDGLLLIESPAATKALPRLALPSSQRDNDENQEPLSVTDLYGRVAQAEDARDAEIIRRKKAEIKVAQIEAEIADKAPILVRQRKEYEQAMELAKTLQNRVEDALDEAAASRNECNALQAEVGRLKTENQDLSQDSKELAKQVRDMLMARSSGVDNPNVALTVSQMQAANQRMMKEYRVMQQKVKELEAKLEQEDRHQEIMDQKAEIAKLVEEREKQEPIVEDIVRQRDLYRAILNQKDTNILGGGNESSALAIVSRQSEHNKVLKQQQNELTKELCDTKSQLEVMEREKTELSDRILRYETLNEDLTKSLDKVNGEVAKDKAAIARSEAEAVFYKDKAQMLEDTQQRNREEIKNITASKNRIMVLNTNLEQSIAKANNECSKMQVELRQARSKLLLAEAESNSAKAAEKRLADESKDLRSELSRHGAVLDSVQRIESSLQLKNNTDIEASKLEIASLKEKLLSTEKKQELALVDMKGKIADQELELKQLEINRASASKEALEAKKESLAAIKKADEASKKVSGLERQLKLAKKKLGQTDESNEQDVESELRAQVESLTVDLEGSKKEVETLKARSATYEKLAKDNEAAVSTLTEASDAAKASLEADIVKLQKELEHSSTEMTKRKEVITELTNDLSSQREERDKAVNQVKKQIAGFKADAENYQKKAEDVEMRFAQLQNDVSTIQSDLAEAQSNYERELALHSAVRTDLRKAREESEEATRLRNTAMEEAATLQDKFKIQQSSLEEVKLKREEVEKEFKEKMGALRAENTLLHTQLEKFNDQVEKMQTRNTGDLTDIQNIGGDATGEEEMLKLRMDVSELRELVKFVRAEKDLLQDQLGAAQRATERERTKASFARRAAEDTQAELKALKESAENKSNDVSDALTDKLKTMEEQSRLLGDSNAHLQQQVQSLQNNLTETRKELDISKRALQPTTNAKKELEADKAALLAEKESLLREINDWKGRVQSLVSRFNQVDPEEHAKIVKKAEELEAQVKSLEEKKSSAEAETKRIRTLASRASTQLSQNKQMVENQKKTIIKLTAEKSALVKAQKDSTSKKDLDELKEKIQKLEKLRETEAIQLKGSTQMNEKLRERLRQFQKTMIDLKKEKESLTKQLTEARSNSEQNAAEKAKAVAPVKKKESAPESVAEKSPVTTSVEPTSKDSSTKAKAAVPVPKQNPVAANSTSSTETDKKDEKQTLPKVPPGGFKFAPSKISAGPISAKKKSDSEPEKNDLASTSKKRPATELSKEEVPSGKKAAITTKTIDEKVEGKAKADKESLPSSNSPPPPNRRNSGEVKEMSLKDKLMEKKRKLMELRKAKEAKQEVSNTSKPVSIEPDAKRNKTESSDGKLTEAAISKSQDKTPSPAPALNAKAASFVPNANALKEAAAAMAAKAASPKANSTGEDGELKESGEKPVTEQTSATGGATSSTASIFGGGSKTQTTFGSGFGSGATPTFGKPSGFGSVGTGFGSAAASGKSAFSFGAAKTEGESKTSSTTQSSGFGGAAFLNIKPPSSSSGLTPQFSFGKTASITLPTPGAATPNPSMNMFNAFSPPAASSNIFGGQAPSKPLFGGIQEKEDKEDKKEDGEAEDGEVPDTTN